MKVEKEKIIKEIGVYVVAFVVAYVLHKFTLSLKIGPIVEQYFPETTLLIVFSLISFFPSFLISLLMIYVFTKSLKKSILISILIDVLIIISFILEGFSQALR